VFHRAQPVVLLLAAKMSLSNAASMRDFPSSDAPAASTVSWLARLQGSTVGKSARPEGKTEEEEALEPRTATLPLPLWLPFSIGTIWSAVGGSSTPLPLVGKIGATAEGLLLPLPFCEVEPPFNAAALLAGPSAVNEFPSCRRRPAHIQWINLELSCDRQPKRTAAVAAWAKNAAHPGVVLVLLLLVLNG